MIKKKRGHVRNHSENSQKRLVNNDVYSDDEPTDRGVTDRKLIESSSDISKDTYNTEEIELREKDRIKNIMDT